jgi:hypothetical protein
MPACASVNVAMQLPRRFKSDCRGDSKMDAGCDLFEDAWFLVPKWKARALVNKEIARVKAEVTRQWMSREKELEKAALSWEKETLALKELEKAELSRRSVDQDGEETGFQSMVGSNNTRTRDLCQ